MDPPSRLSTSSSDWGRVWMQITPEIGTQRIRKPLPDPSLRASIVLHRGCAAAPFGSRGLQLIRLRPLSMPKGTWARQRCQKTPVPYYLRIRPKAFLQQAGESGVMDCAIPPLPQMQEKKSAGASLRLASSVLGLPPKGTGLLCRKPVDESLLPGDRLFHEDGEVAGGGGGG
jgi:hypothetical protein